MTPPNEWLPFIGPIVVALIGTVAGGRYAAKRASQVENRKVDLSVYKDQVDGWRRDVEELRKDREEDRRHYEAELGRLRREHREETTRLSARIDNLVRSREDDERRHRRETHVLQSQLDALVSWSRRVVAITREQGVTIPPPPTGAGDVGVVDGMG